ncbi:YegS/Rv2252/BmrU family lipid kinase [Candidatus Chloroploca sp. Khr17]|uniref:YegS/Rv2252/BmrU family lipid kinase n=1 Tax=Candidatus Chloroploca sp. Khr17 TaxID=2496869 RepID=UPI00101E16AF|nr:YegS/Rv2252/BmrU family lipid kinase [Candidatus Chloroploca sp. Khr17]
MSHLTAIAFQDKHQAGRVLDSLRQFEKDKLVELDEVVVLVRDEDGTLRRMHGLDETLPQVGSAATGVGLGLLVGALASLPIVGMAAGGLLVNRFMSRKQLARRVRQFNDAIEPGMSALFVVGKAANAEELLSQLQPFLVGATFLQTNLPDELLSNLSESVQTPVTTLDGTALKRVKVIINPASGVERPILRPLNRILKEAPFTWDIALTHRSGDAQRLAAHAALDGYDAVIIYGGDGAVMEAASGLTGTGVPLAIIPGGTGNVMSIELGIENNIETAAALLTRDEIPVRDIDMGEVGEQRFALRVATGYEARYVKETTRESKERLGKLAYALTAIKQDLELVRYQLVIDGEAVETEGYTCMVANSGNIGIAGLPLLSRISISDGLLDLVIVQNLNYLSLLRHNVSADEAAERNKMVRHWQAREITVTTEPTETLIGDGEVWGETPFTAKVLPGAVRVIVP